MKRTLFGPIVFGIVLGVALSGASLYVSLQRGFLVRPPDRAQTETDDAHGAKAHADEAVADSHGHAGHEGEQRRVTLSAAARAAAGIEVAPATGGELEQKLTLPGEIVLNADNVAHIVPRVAGSVRRVDKVLGDDVQPGEVMAVLESRELAEAKAAYLAAQQRLSLADANLKSADELHDKKIMPDLEFLGVQKSRAEAAIELKTAENKLHALGVTPAQIAELPSQSVDLALFELRAPFAGTVIQKHCSLGEVLNGEADAFVLADLSTVWAQITVYAQDIRRVQIGQPVRIQADGQSAPTTTTLTYIAPVLNENTRTAQARADLPNADRQWRPGTFVTAAIALSREPVRVLVPLDAVQRLESESVVFVEEDDSFVVRPVILGQVNTTHVEITSGLEPGEHYAVKGAFVLKADHVKSAVSHEH